MNATQTRTDLALMAVHYVNRKTGDYAGARIHLQTCTGCAKFPGQVHSGAGWPIAKTSAKVIATATDAPCVTAA